MRDKSDTSARLQELVRQCKRRLTPHVVKRARSDRGGEFLASELQTFYRETGNLQETAMGYAPPQNGAAERLACSITSDGRTLHQDAASIAVGYIHARCVLCAQLHATCWHWQKDAARISVWQETRLEQNQSLRLTSVCVLPGTVMQNWCWHAARPVRPLHGTRAT
jgi:hypothetical protein